MNKPHVYVRIQPREYPSSDDREVRVCLTEPLLRDTMRVLDYPSEDAGLAGMFCTNEATIERVTLARIDAAKLISAALTRAIVQAMGLRDKRMGYPINTDGSITS